MGKEGFVNWARKYFRQAGMDEQEGDPEAYYDPEISPAENRRLYKENFPQPSRPEVQFEEGLGERVTAYKERGELHKLELAEMREKERLAKIEERENAGAREAASKLERQGYQTIHGMAEEKSREEPFGGIETIGFKKRKKGIFESLKEGYGKFQEGNEEKRLQRAKEKYAKYAHREYVHRLESGANALESREKRRHMDSWLAPFRAIGAGARAVGGRRSPAFSFGRQQQRRGKYIQVIQNGRVHRVAVQQEEGQTGGFMGLSGGNRGHQLGSGSALNMQIGGGNALKMALGGSRARDRNAFSLSGGNTGRFSIGGGKKSMLSLGKGKSKWRL